MANADICPCKLRLSSSQFSSLGKKTVRDSPPRLDAGEGNSILNFGSAHSTSSSNQTYAAALRILAIGDAKYQIAFLALPASLAYRPSRQEK
jgi:hypothetical protein